GERGEGRVDLRRELTCRGEHETARTGGSTAALGTGRVEARDHRQGEGEGLAGAGAAAPEDGASCEGGGQGGRLAGERGRLAVLGEGVADGGRQVKVREGLRRGRHGALWVGLPRPRAGTRLRRA